MAENWCLNEPTKLQETARVSTPWLVRHMCVTLPDSLGPCSGILRARSLHHQLVLTCNHSEPNISKRQHCEQKLSIACLTYLTQRLKNMAADLAFYSRRKNKKLWIFSVWFPSAWTECHWATLAWHSHRHTIAWPYATSEAWWRCAALRIST